MPPPKKNSPLLLDGEEKDYEEDDAQGAIHDGEETLSFYHDEESGNDRRKSKKSKKKDSRRSGTSGRAQARSKSIGETSSTQVLREDTEASLPTNSSRQVSNNSHEGRAQQGIRSLSTGNTDPLALKVNVEPPPQNTLKHYYSSFIEDEIEEEEIEDDDAKATPTGTVICIIANVVGAGLLSLPWTYCEASIVTGTFAMLLTAVLNWGAAYMIAASAESLQVFTYRELGEQTLGLVWGRIAQAVMGLYTFGSCVTYLVLLGDFIPKVMEDLSDSAILTNRALIMVFLSVVILLPLSLLKDLSSLRHTSTLSLLCIAYAFAVIAARAVRHSEPTETAKLNSGVLSAFPIINVSFTFHYNVPRFYRELRPKYRNLRVFSNVVGVSFIICLVLYVSTATLGYFAFGRDTKGNALRGFSESDVPAIIARIGLGFTMAFIYPLAFHSLRTTVFSLAPRAVSHLKCKWLSRSSSETDALNTKPADAVNHYTEEADDNESVPAVSSDDDHTFLSRVVVTLFFVSATIIVAIEEPKVEVVLGYKGSLFGSSIVYIFPALIYCILKWQASSATSAAESLENKRAAERAEETTSWANAKVLMAGREGVGDPDDSGVTRTPDAHDRGAEAAAWVEQVRQARKTVSPWKNLSISCLAGILRQSYGPIILFYLVWGLISIVVGTMKSTPGTGTCPHNG
eukprot:gb/GECG01012341.1/.p1 GENE.gb/GECG01012341.1/~~gb/GECG01012341.1/.p1  ORF type:complete len:685 (+),score=79.80 gb/GECG01012341.1/:1-2055(+)